MNTKVQKASGKAEAGRTERFNATVKLGGKTYLPGRPVPVGGKDGMSAEEVENIRHNFGDYLTGTALTSDTGPTSTEADHSVRDLRIKTLEAEKHELEARLAAKTELYDKLVIDHSKLGEDNLVLVERVQQLEEEAAAHKKGD